ncbi:uncharacterized protein LOC122511257 [Leptopilina heterotoma]|uniref:uncharacterized protein LOC122511257 n=1 Tax=Leptopilina heterotoma TaxID=63436 RepID=UPI001CAA0B8A|nr:uncharacterized protein LOC122511257 [Leptopilina heterotoma]
MGNIISNRDDMDKSDTEEEVIQSDENLYTEFVFQDRIEMYKKMFVKQREQYMLDVEKAESYIDDKITIANNCEYGNDEVSATNLIKDHDLLMKDLEDLRKLIVNLKTQVENIKILESKLKILELEASIQELSSTSIIEELLTIPVNEIQAHLDCKFKHLIKSAKYRQKQLNATSKTFILLREAGELQEQIKNTIIHSEMEYKKISEDLAKSEFIEYYKNYQTSIRTCKINLIILDQMDREISKLDNKEHQVLELRQQIEILKEKSSSTFKKMEPTFERQRLLHDIDDISNSLDSKFHEMLLTLTLAEKDESIYLNFRAFHDKNLINELSTFNEKIYEINKRQNFFLKTNPTLAEDNCKFKKINSDWMFLTESIMKAREIIFQREEKLRIFYDCRQMLGTLLSQMSVISATMTNLRDINHNLNLRR